MFFPESVHLVSFLLSLSLVSLIFFCHTRLTGRVFRGKVAFRKCLPLPRSSRRGERRPTTKFVLHELTLFFSSSSFFFYLSFSPVFSSLLVSLQLLREWKDRRRTPRSPITMSLGNAQIRKALASCRISCKDFRITAPPPDRIFEALEVKS